MEYIILLLIGIILIVLGGINIGGNIKTIHWYNRRKVTEENVKPYGRTMGIGTATIGISVVATAILQLIKFNENYFL